jgi:eukaryotic-like serine/threonine-protein kinase
MPIDRPCPECGQTLPADAPDGVCPVCSLQSALKAANAGPFIAAPAGSAVAPPSTLNLQPSTHFGDYELLELLAQGGMGVVYKARQVSLNRTVALKMIQAGVLATPAEVKRFQSEAEAIAHLHHPNIVAVHEIGEHAGQHYFSMDYVAGRTLADLVKDGPLPAARAAAYVKTIAGAVHYAHERGIIHRDLKPANVIVDEDDQPRITDFGLAKRLTDSQFSTLNPQLTLSGQVLGSPNYLPPEQAEPKRGVPGPASDVYALGAILYHLITGRPPFQAESLTTLLRQVIEADPVSPRSLNPNIPRDLETLCLKCLEKEPHRRYATAQTLAEELGCFLHDEPITARPVTAAIKAWKWCRRRPVRAGLSAALVLTLLAGLTAVWWQMQRTRASALEARQNAYAADMSLAQVAVENGDIGAALNLLGAHRPAAGQTDLRGWEWRYLWQRCQGDELFTLTNAIPAQRVAYSADGRWLAVADAQANLTLWDVGARRPVRSLKMYGYLDPFAFSKQGHLLGYYASGARAVSVVNLDSWQERARFPHTNNVAHLAFSADGSRLSIFEEEGTFNEWDIASRQALSTSKVSVSVSSENIDALAFSPDGRILAMPAENGLELREVNSDHFRHIDLEEAPTALRFSPDGKLLAAGIGGSDSEVWVWAVEELWRSPGAAPPPRWKLGKHRDWICSMAFSPDSRALVSASADSAVRVWEFERPGPGRRYQGHRYQVLSVAWSPDGRTVASGGWDGSVRFWDPWREPAPSGPQVLPVTSRLWCLSISTNGKRVLTVDPASGAVLVWDTVNLRLAERLAFAGSNNMVAAWSPNEKTLATGDGLGNVRIWDLTNEREVAHMLVPGYMIGHFHFTYDGRFLACGVVGPGPAYERLPKLWSADGWREIPPFPHEVLKDFLFGDFSPESGHCLMLHWGGAIDIWNTSGKCQARLSQPLAGPHELGEVRFSPNGRSWASSTQRGVLCLWDGAKQRPPVLITRSTQELWSLAFSPDGSRLLVSGKRASDAVRLLDLANNRFVLTLSGKADVYWHVGMSRDNSTVYAMGEKDILLWRAPSWAEIEAAENR